VTASHGYVGLVVEAYDLHGPPYDDTAFYRERIEDAGGAALEVGSGTGRLLIPYREAGLDVEGLEPSPEMRAVCQRKAADAGVEVIQHDQYMQALDLARTYRTIYIPVSTFQLLDDVEDARAALRCFHSHLEPGGQLLISLFIPAEDELAQNNEWRLRRRLPRPDGGTILLSTASRVYRDRRLIRTTQRYELFGEGGALTRTEMHASSLRWYEREEFGRMLEEAGFTDIASTGDVGEGVDPDRLMMFRAVR